MAVIGGGLAGIAAAEAASRKGFQVDLFEWSRVLGGRAASLFEPTTGRWIDNGQHLALGCCKELLALHARLRLDSYFARHETIPFAQSGGKRWTMHASPFLPGRWQLVPAFLKIPFLSFKERLATGLLIRKLEKLGRRTADPAPDSNKRSFADWLASEQASESAIRIFWSPLVFSALSETLENVSFQAVLKVIRDGFLAGKEAMSLHVPQMPLRTIYHEETSKRLRELDVRIHFQARIRRLHWAFSGNRSEEMAEEDDDASQGAPSVLSLELADGSRHSFDRYILAVPVNRAWEILEASELESYADRLGFERFEPGAITTLHLWFNRRILPTSWHHAALLGGPGQFLFCPDSDVSRNGTGTFQGVYHTVVISAAHRLLSEGEMVSRKDSPLVQNVVQQLRSTFPEVFGAGKEDEEDSVKLLHSRVTTFFDAVFSPNPTVYSERPRQETPFSNLTLGGDWTQTDWPSTLEGAVLSGRAAVEALADTD